MLPNISGLLIFFFFFLQVIAAAKQGFKASGFELNPWLVWYSRYKAWREGVHRSTAFHISDLWKVRDSWTHS